MLFTAGFQKWRIFPAKLTVAYPVTLVNIVEYKINHAPLIVVYAIRREKHKQRLQSGGPVINTPCLWGIKFFISAPERGTKVLIK